MVDKINLTVYQGTDFRRMMELKDETEALIDLTNYDFRGQLKADYSSAPVVSMIFTVRDQATYPGCVDLHIPALATSALQLDRATDFIYDIEMVDPSLDVRRVMEGKIKIFPEVTK